MTNEQRKVHRVALGDTITITITETLKTFENVDNVAIAINFSTFRIH